jgi:hypothetical protein
MTNKFNYNNNTRMYNAIKGYIYVKVIDFHINLPL